MTTTLSITKARQDLPTLVNNAQKKLHDYIITVKGSPAAMLISVDEYESLQETLDILSDKKTMKDIKEAEKEIEKGNYVTLEEFEKEMGWDVPAKHKRKIAKRD